MATKINNGTTISVEAGVFPGTTQNFLIAKDSTVGDLKTLATNYNFSGYTMKRTGGITVTDSEVLEDGVTYYGVKELKAN